MLPQFTMERGKAMGIRKANVLDACLVPHHKKATLPVRICSLPLAPPPGPNECQRRQAMCRQQQRRSLRGGATGYWVWGEVISVSVTDRTYL